jgi:type III pantothenate kinase
VLAVDVHNAQTHFGLFERDVLVDDWWAGTRADATPDALASDLAEMLAIRNVGFEDLRGSIVSSAVPNLSRSWPRAGAKHLGQPMLVVGTALRSGMPMRIEHPGELGANRLVNAVAAYERVKQACIVVDFSTAIAFDIVSKGGEYMGSVFAPGLDISFDKIAPRTATLPPTPRQAAAPAGSPPAPPAGVAMVAAIRSGTVYGAAGLCDGIVARIQLEMDEDPVVLATGPRASFITEFCDTIEDVDTSLTLEGLRIIHARNS